MRWWIHITRPVDDNFTLLFILIFFLYSFFYCCCCQCIHSSIHSFVQLNLKMYSYNNTQVEKFKELIMSIRCVDFLNLTPTATTARPMLLFNEDYISSSLAVIMRYSRSMRNECCLIVAKVLLFAFIMLSLLFMFHFILNFVWSEIFILTNVLIGDES